MLVSTPVLSSLDFEKTFILQTDVSNYEISAVLSQTDPDGLKHPVEYFRGVNYVFNREQKYSAIKKECLAIKLAVKGIYLAGHS